MVTQPLWVGSATAYQVALPAADAVGAPVPTAPEGGAAPLVVLVRPDGGHLEVEAESIPAGAQSLGQPAIHTRAEWSARAPSNPIASAPNLKLAVVHHSATGNDYTQADVPGILRSIQAYHIDSNGWSDIGYNFAVDKFGGIWEGRDGSLNGNSIGAHAEGFNSGSVGVVALGNYENGTPTPAQVGSVTEVIAWRFASSAIDPTSSVAFTSGGSSTVPAGTVVNLPRVVGHRDVGSTDCPGSALYSRLASQIRPALPAAVASKLSPIGVLDAVNPGPGNVTVGGWAFDPLVAAPIDVHVYIDGVGENIGEASLERPELERSYPGAGSRHGYARTFTGLAPGAHEVCVFGINVGPGVNTLLACRGFTVLTGDPIGVVDTISAGVDGRLDVSGWSIDPDTSAPNEVHVYVDGRGINTGPAGVARDDIRQAFPGYGADHGFSWSADGVVPGTHDVCVFFINVGAGGNRLAGCRTVTVPGGRPVGVVDRIEGGPDGRVAVSGWSFDPDTNASNEVHVYVDGKGVNLGPANQARPDIGAAFPGYGSGHGYSWASTGLVPGFHNVCVFGIDARGGQSNSLFRCQWIGNPGGSPYGAIDAVTGSGDRVAVSGWVVDPDVSAPATVHVYVDGIGFNAGPASAARPDVAGAVPGYGPAHGISWTSPPVGAGAHQICVYGINVGMGGTTLLGCRMTTTS